MKKNYQVYSTQNKKKSWEIPRCLGKELNLKENRQAQLRFGSLSTQVPVKFTSSPRVAENRIFLSTDVLNALRMPKGISLKIKPVSSDQFRIGPIIGIMTFPHVISQKGFRRYKPYAIRMIGKGFLYVFGPNDIHPESSTVIGYRYNLNNNTWQAGEYPFPDVVIDRTYPNNPKIHLILEKKMGPGKIFNKKTLINKLEFNSALCKDPFLKDFLPETEVFDLSNLEYFLGKYRQIFLKPLDAMKGRGIVFVSNENDGLLCRFMEGLNPVSEKITDVNDISGILKRAGNGKRQYIIQAAVPRMEFQSRPFSFRIMTVKDGNGNWTVPAFFAKVARPGGFLTNNSAGADFISLKSLFHGIGGQISCSKENLLDLLAGYSIKAAKVLDEEYGPLGKLGIDIVLDTSGKPWLMEANGNPGRIPRDCLGEYPAWSSQMYDYPLAYASYLAGFN